MPKKPMKFEGPKQAHAHVKMAATNVLRALPGRSSIPRGMVVKEAQRHNIPVHEVEQELRKKGISLI